MIHKIEDSHDAENQTSDQDSASERQSKDSEYARPAGFGKVSNHRINGVHYEANFTIKKTPHNE